jgi:hypothetical protein
MSSGALPHLLSGDQYEHTSSATRLKHMECEEAFSTLSSTTARIHSSPDKPFKIMALIPHWRIRNRQRKSSELSQTQHWTPIRGQSSTPIDTPDIVMRYIEHMDVQKSGMARLYAKALKHFTGADFSSPN